MGEFERELTGLINKYSFENQSNTPDYVLSKYMMACLTAYNEAVKSRDWWYGIKLSPDQIKVKH